MQVIVMLDWLLFTLGSFFEYMLVFVVTLLGVVVLGWFDLS